MHVRKDVKYSFSLHPIYIDVQTEGGTPRLMLPGSDPQTEAQTAKRKQAHSFPTDQLAR